MKSKKFLLKVAVALCGSTAFILMFNFLPLWVTAAMSTLITELIFYELSVNARLVTALPLRVIGFAVSALIPWIMYFELEPFWLFFVIFASEAAAFTTLAVSREAGKANEIINLLFCESVFQLSISLMVPILRADYGVPFILMAFISAWGTDAFAQIGGKCFGKTKCFSSISPNKTLEGSLSGIVGNAAVITVFALILGHIYPEISAGSKAAIIACGTFCGIAGEAGDLFFSYIKRTVGIKDFGRFIAGHGGALDRFDSVVFVLPVWYAVITAMKL